MRSSTGGVKIIEGPGFPLRLRELVHKLIDEFPKGPPFQFHESIPLEERVLLLTHFFQAWRISQSSRRPIELKALVEAATGAGKLPLGAVKK